MDQQAHIHILNSSFRLYTLGPVDSFFLAASFSPSGIVWTKSAQILGVCGVPWRCLEGVWKGLGIVWDDSGYCLGGL